MKKQTSKKQRIKSKILVKSKKSTLGIFWLILLIIIGGLFLFKNTSLKKVLGLTTGNIYYVSSTGSDSNDGTVDKPWATLQKAADNAKTPGDIVNIKPGTYPKSFGVRHSGSENAPITFRRDGTLPVVIVASNSDAVISISQHDWIILDGLTVKGNNNMAHIGIVTRNANNITIQNCDISESGIGIHITAGNSSYMESTATSHNNAIIGNTIHDTDPNHAFGLGEAIYIKNYMPAGISTSFTQNTLIENNHIYNADEAVQNTGATWTSSGTLEYLATSVLPAYTTIRSNRIHNNRCEQGVITAGGEGLIEEYNLIYNNGGTGSKCSLGVGGNAKNVFVHHNVLFNNGGTQSIRAAMNIKEASGEISNNTIVNFDNRGIMLTYQFPSPGNLVIKNNIVTGIAKLQIHRSVGGDYDGIGDMSKVILDYNLFGKSEANIGTHYLIDDPQFVNSTDPTNSNFLRPQLGSPACNQGENGTYIGAFPCETSATPTPTTTTSTTVTPTPAPTPNLSAPLIKISTPSNGASYAGMGYSFPIKTTASDASGVSKIQIYFGSNRLKTCSNTSKCDTKKSLVNIKKGTHTITVYAWDKDGNMATKKILVYRR